MPIYLGTTEIGKVYLGATEMKRVYRGSTLIFQRATPAPAIAQNQLLIRAAAEPDRFIYGGQRHETRWARLDIPPRADGVNDINIGGTLIQPTAAPQNCLAVWSMGPWATLTTGHDLGIVLLAGLTGMRLQFTGATSGYSEAVNVSAVEGTMLFLGRNWRKYTGYVASATALPTNDDLTVTVTQSGSPYNLWTP